MLNLIISIIVICIVIGILKAVIDALGKIILGIIGIALIIAAIVFLGPPLLKLLSFFPKLLPWILVILAVLIVLGSIATFLEKRHYRAELKRLDELGIDSAGSVSNDWEKMKRSGLIEVTSSGYAVSISFYKRVIKRIGQTTILSIAEFKEHCSSCAIRFQESLTTPLLKFLYEKSLLFQFSLSNGQVYILSKSFMDRCESLFLTTGAATECEFEQICNQANLLCKFPLESRNFARFFLNYLISCNKIYTVDLDGSNDRLYIAKKQQQDSSFVRREITLD